MASLNIWQQSTTINRPNISTAYNPHIPLLFCFSPLNILEMNRRTFMSIYPRFLLQP